MGKNTGSSHRKGAMKDRTQAFNKKSGMYIKRDKKTGQFISSKKSPYKGVTKETSAKKK